MAVRLKDIAEDLELSLMTVSKALRHHPDISAETRARVMKRVKELDYRPNLAARSLVTGRSYAIGLVVPDLVHPFFGQIAKAFQQVLRDREYSLFIASSDGDAALEQREIDQLLSRRVDVLVLASALPTAESLRILEEQRKPYILIDRRFPGISSHFVGIDDAQVGKLATEHLVDTGCRRLAHIGGPDVSTARERADAFRAVLSARGIPLRPGYVRMRERADEPDDSSGYNLMRALLEKGAKPDGVFCYSDPTAMGAMKAVLEAGLRIPEDVSLVGCGNVAYSAFMRVPLTTIDQQSHSVGAISAKLALSLLEKPVKRTRQMLLEPKLVVRESTRGTRLVV